LIKRDISFVFQSFEPRKKICEALKRIRKIWHRENKTKIMEKTIQKPWKILSPHSFSSSKSASSVRPFRHEYFPYFATTSKENRHME